MDSSTSAQASQIKPPILVSGELGDGWDFRVMFNNKNRGNGEILRDFWGLVGGMKKTDE